MTFSATGVAHNNVSGSLVLANQAIGNLLVVEVINYANNTVWCTGLTGGGATWVPAGVKFAGTTNTQYATVFFGTVTATGAQTAVPTWSGTAPSWIITGQEFHSTVGFWSLDVQGNLDNAGTTNFVSLTPAGAGELYFGYSSNSVSPTLGSTSGYVYADDTNGNAIAYNVNCPGTATFPVWGANTQQFGIMVLVKEVTSTYNPAGFQAPLPPTPNFFPGADVVVCDPSGIPFAIQPYFDPSLYFSIPPVSGLINQTSLAVGPSWFPGADGLVCTPGDIPFSGDPQPGWSVQIPAALNAGGGGAGELLPAALIPPGWFPGCDGLAGRPGQTPFTVPQIGAPITLGGTACITTASGDGTYFQDQYGSPRLYIGEDAWGLAPQAGVSNGGNWQSAFDTYFSQRAAQGYTATEVCLVSSGDPNVNCTYSTGRDWDGTWPFNGNFDPTTTPNETFWTRRDYMFKSAQAQGITVHPNFPGVGPSSAAASWSTAQWQAYGTFLGNRYKGQPNILWIAGDGNFGGYNAGLSSWLTSFRATGNTQLVSYQGGDETSSRRGFGSDNAGADPEAFMINAQYDWVYTYNTSYQGVISAITQEPSGTDVVQGRIPVVWGDGTYLNSAQTAPQTDIHLEQNLIWWALSSGACGVSTGDNNIFPWASGAAAAVTSNSFYSATMPAITSYFKSLANWWKLRPDSSNALVTAGRNSQTAAISTSGSPYSTNNDNYVTAARATDGSLAVIYCAKYFSITIDQTKLGTGYTATWVDPMTAATTTATPGSTYNSTSNGLSAGGFQDWVLVLQGPPAGPSTFSGAASIAGAGATTAVVTQGVTATAAGAGSVTAVATVIPATATSAGAGAATALVTEIAPATAAGAGAVTDVATQAVTAAAAGAGAATALVTQAAPGATAGAGSVTSVVTQAAPGSATGAGLSVNIVTQTVTAAAAGAGSVADVATQAVTGTATGAGAATAAVNYPGVSAAAGAGSAAALATQIAPEAAAGAGASTAVVTQPAPGSAAGTGATGTDPVTQAVTASAAGTGATGADPVTQMVTASAAGAGAASALVTEVAPGTAAGAGSTGTDPVTQAVTAAAAGASSTGTDQVTQVVTGAAAAAGSVTAIGGPLGSGTGTAAGAGAATGLATQAVPGTAAGAGAVTVGAAQIAPGTAAGSGSATALATQSVTAGAAGAGAVADVVTQPAVALAAGAGATGTSPVIQAVTGAAAGAGAVTAAGSTGGAATGAAAGAGVVTALATQIAAGTAAGSGAAVSAPVQGATGIAAGAGSVTAAGSALATGTATAAGAGAVTAAVVQRVTGTAAGAGAVTANAGGTAISSADTAHAVESAFYYITGTGDTATAAEGGATVRVRGTDKASATDAPLSAWPGSHDTSRAVDMPASAWPAGGDMARGTEGWKPFHFAGADSAAGLEVMHEMGIWTYVPVNVHLLGKFWRITGTDAHGEQVTILQGERITGQVLALAERLSWSRVTVRVSSADSVSSAEAAGELAGVTCWVQPAVTVSVSAQEIR